MLGKNIFDNILDNVLEIIYGKDKTKIFLIILFIAGFLLRIIAATNSGLSADDAGHALRAIGAIDSGKLEEYGQSSILWYLIQDFSMNIFSTSNLGSRMMSVFFGSFFIILAFLFVKQLFKSKTAGLIAATISAFSPWFIHMTLPEMDMAATFFVLFSALFLFKFIENFEKKDLIFSAILIGIAIMIKIYALFFAFSFFLFLLYYSFKKKNGAKFVFKIAVIFCLIAFIFCIPTLTHNYLLYKDKGFVDYMMTNFLKIGIEKSKQYYEWAPGWNTPTDFKGFLFGKQKIYLGSGKGYLEGSNLPGFVTLLKDFFKTEPVIMVFGVLGLISLYLKKQRKYLFFFFLSIAIPFVFLGAHISMLKHQTYMPVLLVAPASFLINSLYEKMKLKKIRLRYVLSVIVIFNLVWLGIGPPINTFNSIYVKSSESNLIDVKLSEINENSFVIADARIFRGVSYWMFHDRNFAESSLFNQLMEESKKYNENVNMELYFVECVIDDCGWGTIKDQPEFNKSVEDMINWFKNNSQIVSEVYGPDYVQKYYFPFISKSPNIMRYRVYKTEAILPSAIIPMSQSTHNFLLYPIGYDRTFGELFDDYKIHTGLDELLSKLAHYILYGNIVLSLLSLLFLLHLLIVEDIKESQENEVH